MKNKNIVPEFLVNLLHSRSPSGYEYEAHTVLEKYLKPYADIFEKDTLGNRFATINSEGAPTLMLAGHMDEIGLMVQYVDEQGFIYFDMIGGHDLSIISGRRIRILSKKGDVLGVTGKRAIHLMSPEERKKVPELHQIWIDIGAKNKKEVLDKISIGDPVVYEDSFEIINGSKVVARAFDDRAGCYVVCEVIRRLASHKKKLTVKLVSVATTQEEVGTRGAQTAAYKVNPDFAIAVDVGHATDHPDCDKKKNGEFKLGAGPIICRGVNINPFIYERLLECAKKNKIPYQIEAESKPTGTDARVLQMTRSGVATGLVSIPLRYMHTPCEMADLNDIENTVKLLAAFALSIKKTEKGDW